jgi:hypothetical protein
MSMRASLSIASIVLLTGFVAETSSLPTQANAQAMRQRQVVPLTATIAACAFNRRSSGLCFGSPQFLTYLAAASACGEAGGRLPTLGELVAYRFGSGSAETGIDCSSDWDAGAGTLWCVGDKGQVSGTGIPNQAEGLSKVRAEFRCVTYLK